MSNQEAVASLPLAGAVRHFGGLRILLVEDNVADAEMIKRVLAQRAAVGTIDHATDGVEALRMLADSLVAPDLAIVDLHMPRMDGFKLLIEMSCRGFSGFPVVVLTSSTAHSDVVRSLCRGADKVVSKPDSADELERELVKMIASI